LFRTLICCLIKKLRLHFFALLRKAAKNLRLSQAQSKKLVKKLISPEFEAIMTNQDDGIQDEEQWAQNVQ